MNIHLSRRQFIEESAIANLAAMYSNADLFYKDPATLAKGAVVAAMLLAEEMDKISWTSNKKSANSHDNEEQSK